jgi:hypothetical protein
VYLGDRPDNVCLIHALKPFVFTDGWVYCCPSSELAPENDRTMQERFRVCEIKNIRMYYNARLQKQFHNCSYCKYTMQNNILNALITETDDNDFC